MTTKRFPRIDELGPIDTTNPTDLQLDAFADHMLSYVRGGMEVDAEDRRSLHWGEMRTGIAALFREINCAHTWEPSVSWEVCPKCKVSRRLNTILEVGK